HHALAAAIRAANPIRAVWPVAVVLVDQVFRGQRGHLDRLIGIHADAQRIEEELVVVSERAGVCASTRGQVGIQMSAILAGDGVTVRDLGNTCSAAYGAGSRRD